LAWAHKEFEKSLQEAGTGAVAEQYLSERKFSGQTLRQFGLGFAPPEFDWLLRRAKGAGFDEPVLQRAGLIKSNEQGRVYDTFRGRVMVPIRDVQGRVIAFGGRLIPALDDGRAPKYLNSPATDVYNKSRVLYGLDVAAEGLRAKKTSGGTPPLVVMEGYMDCLMAYQAGMKTAVATCGTSLTLDHVRRLRSYTDQVVLMFDGDSAGQRAAREATSLFLESEVDLRLCLLPDGLDPCDFIERHGIVALEHVIEESRDAIEFAIAEAREAHASEGLAGRNKAMDAVLETLASLPGSLRSEQQQRADLAVNRIAEVFRVDEGSVRRRLSEMRGDRRAEARRFRADGADATSPLAPLPLREKQITELMVTMPGQAADWKGLLSVEDFRHPELRNIVQTCFRILDTEGSAATTESLREALGESRLDSLVLDLLDAAPKGEAFRIAWEDVGRQLAEERRQRELSHMVRQDPSASDDEHLAALKEFQRHRAQ
jgi:DNA primase